MDVVITIVLETRSSSSSNDFDRNSSLTNKYVSRAFMKSNNNNNKNNRKNNNIISTPFF